MAAIFRRTSSLFLQQETLVRSSTFRLSQIPVFSQGDKVAHFSLRFFSTGPDKQRIQVVQGGRDAAGRDINRQQNWHKGDNVGGDKVGGDKAGGHIIKIGGGALAVVVAGYLFCRENPEVELCDRIQLALGGKKNK